MKLSNIYPGWWVVAGIFFALTVSSGLGFYNLSVYMNSIVADHQFAVADVSVAVTIFFVTGGLAGLWVGKLLETYEIRTIMSVGVVIGGAGLGLTAFATELWQFYVLYGVFGLGNAGIGLLIASTLVTRWFPGPNRSIALSVSTTGLSVGGILITPLSARIINEFGFEAVLPWLGLGFALLLLPIALFVLRVPPEAVAAREASHEADEPADWEFGAAVRTRFFVLVTAAYVLCMGAQVGGIAHLYNHGENLIDYVAAATAVQALTLMSIGGRFLGGFLATKIALRPFTLFNVLLQALGFFLLSRADSNVTLILGAGVFGASIGNLLMLHPLVLADAFGVTAYPRIFAWSNLFTMVGVAGGPLALGVLHDLSGYVLAYAAGVVMSLGAFVLMFFAGGRPRLALA